MQQKEKICHMYKSKANSYRRSIMPTNDYTLSWDALKSSLLSMHPLFTLTPKKFTMCELIWYKNYVQAK